MKHRSLTEISSEVAKFSSKTQHMWFPHFPKSDLKKPNEIFEEQKETIDAMLGYGSLDSEFVFQRMGQYEASSRYSGEKVINYFEKRLEEWYPEAVEKYKKSVEESDSSI